MPPFFTAVSLSTVISTAVVIVILSVGFYFLNNMGKGKKGAKVIDLDEHERKISQL